MFYKGQQCIWLTILVARRSQWHNSGILARVPKLCHKGRRHRKGISRMQRGPGTRDSLTLSKLTQEAASSPSGAAPVTQSPCTRPCHLNATTLGTTPPAREPLGDTQNPHANHSSSLIESQPRRNEQVSGKQVPGSGHRADLQPGIRVHVRHHAG